MTTSAASFPVEEMSIAALQAAYLSGRATAVSVCQAHLDRIAAYDRRGPALGAIIINNPDALADAAALDAALASTGKLIGPLHGVPVLVKDNYDVAGLQTTGGSAALVGWVPEADASDQIYSAEVPLFAGAEVPLFAGARSLDTGLSRSEPVGCRLARFRSGAGTSPSYLAIVVRRDE